MKRIEAIAKSIFVGAHALIINGSCKGIKGEVIGADSANKKIILEPEPGTTIETDWENVTNVTGAPILRR